MTLVYGIAIGIAAFYLGERILLRFVRKQFDPSRTKSVRKNLLDGMGYDALLVFQLAVAEEIARRRPPA